MPVTREVGFDPEPIDRGALVAGIVIGGLLFSIGWISGIITAVWFT